MIFATARETTTSCPLCGSLVWATRTSRISTHFGRERSVDGTRTLNCRASMATKAEARKMAEAEAAELDALRRRAHP